MDSIGEILRLEREKRGLSVEEAHDATKIAVSSIAALEEDRFDAFPNKVYARAFLRDYANFLGLDSAVLLEAYEQKWSPTAETDAAVMSKRGGSAWRAIGWSFLVIVLAAAIAGGGYYALYTIQHQRAGRHAGVAVRHHVPRPETATIPREQPVPPPTEPAAQPNQPALPASPATTPAPDRVTLQVSARDQVWVRVRADGKVLFMGNMEKGQTRTFEGKVVNIRAGKAGAVQLKLNGVTQPPLGTLKEVGDKTFALPGPSSHLQPPQPR